MSIRWSPRARCRPQPPQAALQAQVEELTRQLAAARERAERLEQLIVQVGKVLQKK